MKNKVVKNPEAPGGRKDWEGRTPRRRINLTNAQLQVLKEWADDYFNRHPERRLDPLYSDLYERIGEHIENIATPLTTEVEDYPLFEGNWNFDKNTNSD